MFFSKQIQGCENLTIRPEIVGSLPSNVEIKSSKICESQKISSTVVATTSSAVEMPTKTTHFMMKNAVDVVAHNLFATIKNCQKNDCNESETIREMFNVFRNQLERIDCLIEQSKMNETDTTEPQPFSGASDWVN